jgi:hypothetical protein
MSNDQLSMSNEQVGTVSDITKKRKEARKPSSKRETPAT